MSSGTGVGMAKSAVSVGGTAVWVGIGVFVARNAVLVSTGVSEGGGEVVVGGRLVEAGAGAGLQPLKTRTNKVVTMRTQNNLFKLISFPDMFRRLTAKYL